MVANNPHDKLFKKTFSHPENAAELLRCNLPPALLTHIDLQSLAAEPGSFVDEALRERFTDLLFSAEIAGRAGFVYLLLEHKSRSDEMTAFQLARYVMDILSEHRSGNPEERTLPAVIPLVVHHGAGQWRGARRLRELYDVPEELCASAGEYLLDLGFIVDDIGAESDAKLRRRTMAKLPLLALWLLWQAMRDEDVVTALPRAAKLFREARARVGEAQSGVEMFVAMLQYIMEISDASPEVIATVLHKIEPQTSEVYMSTAERLREQGMKEGRKEGRVDGQRGILLMQLEARFGPLPGAVVTRVSRAPVKQINAWARAVLTASSIDELAGLSEGAV